MIFNQFKSPHLREWPPALLGSTAATSIRIWITMKITFHLAFITFGLMTSLRAQSNFALLTREHTDLRILYQPGTSNVLDFVARDEDNRINYASNQVVLIAKEQSRVTLPAGTPFGNGGQPFWILPQSQNVNLLYLGVSAEGIPQGVFSGPLTVQLKAIDAPGYFMVWQAVGPGLFNIRVNTRDGISVADAFTPIIGSHEHFNWGFSQPGVYCLTFQVTGRRANESTNLVSRECTFAFQVQPPPPATNFVTWQKQFWPPGFNPAMAGAAANPDGDAFDNWHEYAFGLSPTNANPIAAAPMFSFVDTGGESYGALTYSRYLPARDLNYAAEATGILSGGWTALTEVFDVTAQPGGLTERVTVRDTSPTTRGPRFLQLRLEPR